MLNYQMFKENVKMQFSNYMPEEFEGYQLSIKPVFKINQRLDAISLLPPENPDITLNPQIYLNDIYEYYQQCGDFDQALESAAFALIRTYKNMSIDSDKPEYKIDKSKIIMALINTNQNKELLKSIPHRVFLDLSIVYRHIVVNTELEEIQMVTITNTLAKHMEMTEDALFRTAAENTIRLFPPVIKNMYEVLAEIKPMECEELPHEYMLYMIGNKNQFYGASSMLYENELHNLAENLGTDLYIMPSSIHEVMAISAEFHDPNELAEMVTEINMNELPLKERLSNQVYHYDKDLRKLSLATDTPNKRLDSIKSA